MIKSDYIKWDQESGKIIGASSSTLTAYPVLNLSNIFVIHFLTEAYYSIVLICYFEWNDNFYTRKTVLSKTPVCYILKISFLKVIRLLK